MTSASCSAAAAASPWCSTSRPRIGACKRKATGSTVISPPRGTAPCTNAWRRSLQALSSPPSPAHIRGMTEDPDRPGAPPKPRRDPAKHSKKDPARPTRAKAAREQLPAIAPALEQLLNPGIQKGTAGPGSQTGLKPPPDNSFDRRADFAAAHKARSSTPSGFSEAPQKGYVAKMPLARISDEVAKAFGRDSDEEAELPARGSGVTATASALERLLREGRPEFGERPWVPHRPPRPDKTEGGFRLVIKSDFEDRKSDV